MMDCKNCTKASVYNADPVPFVVHENMRAQMDSANRRLIQVIVLLIVLLVGSNLAWMIYEGQYETVRVEQENERGTGRVLS